MSLRLTHQESLGSAPTASRWGRTAVRVYLAAAGGAALLMVRELFAGSSGTGTMAISVLTAPWSVLLASVAPGLAPRLGPGAMRTLGLVFVVLAVLLNARILYGIAARAERDAIQSRKSGGSSNG